MDALMHRIEWTTLLFFASMFVTLECLERLRLIHWFSEQTINLISTSENENTQLACAIFIVLWVSRKKLWSCGKQLLMYKLIERNYYFCSYLVYYRH